MSTDNAAASKDRLIERAESRIAEEGMTWEDPLDIEVNGKYVDILFTTGGPHVEVQIEFASGEGGEFWFEHAPMYGRVIYMDWGTREEVFINAEEAHLIQSAVMRDPDDLIEPHDFECEDQEDPPEDSDVCDSCGEFRDQADVHPTERSRG